MNFQHFRIKCDFNAISSEKTATSWDRRIRGKNTKNIFIARCYIFSIIICSICIYIWPFAFYLIDCNVFSLFNLICEYVRPCNLNAACGELCDLWHDWLNCHGENDVSWLMTSHKGFQIFVQSHSWKFPSANGNVNENENIL